MSILVIAPHPDDEVLGVGGTIARLAAEGEHVTVAIVTRGYPPEFDEESVHRAQREVGEAHGILGIGTTLFLDFPAAGLDVVPHRELNARLSELMREMQPREVFAPFAGDLHLDHQRSFLSALVAARPNGEDTPASIYAYETLSETNWNAPYLAPTFAPNVFVDISGYLERKILALQAFASQIKPFPHERSVEAARALAALRGSAVNRPAAEGFVLVRELR